MNQFRQLLHVACSPILVLCALSLVFVTGCSLESSKNRDIDTSNARRAKLDTNIGLEDLRDLAKPANAQESSGVTANVSRGKGLNLDPKSSLFIQSLSDPDDRLDRLETAVQNLRDDFDKMAPSISRLVATEKDIQDLLAQLKTLLDGEDDPQPLTGVGAATAIGQASAPEAVAETVKPQPRSPPPAKVSAPVSSAKGLRVADHPDKTRIVFETSSKQNFVVSYDEAEQLVLVETSAAVSQNEANTLKSKSKRVSDASVSAGDGGKSLLAITTQNISRIGSGSHIGPNKDNRNHRYFFDMVPR